MGEMGGGGGGGAKIYSSVTFKRKALFLSLLDGWLDDLERFSILNMYYLFFIFRHLSSSSLGVHQDLETQERS